MVGGVVGGGVGGGVVGGGVGGGGGGGSGAGAAAEGVAVVVVSAPAPANLCHPSSSAFFAMISSSAFFAILQVLLLDCQLPEQRKSNCTGIGFWI